jgi:hypothetical protein
MHDEIVRGTPNKLSWKTKPRRFSKKKPKKKLRLVSMNVEWKTER